MRMLLTLILLGAMTLAAGAAEITVITPGITAPVLQKLARQWQAQSGHAAHLAVAGIPATEARAKTGPGDVVFLPPQALAGLGARVKAESVVRLPSVKFALVVRKGAAHPDISTVEKLAAALKAAPGVAFNDPSGSAAGRQIAGLLQRPEFAGVVARPVISPAEAFRPGGPGVYAGVVSEALTVPEVEVAGTFPASLGWGFDFSGAVLADAKEPAAAQAFLDYVTAPAQRPAWTAAGFETP